MSAEAWDQGASEAHGPWGQPDCRETARKLTRVLHVPPFPWRVVWGRPSGTEPVERPADTRCHVFKRICFLCPVLGPGVKRQRTTSPFTQTGLQKEREVGKGHCADGSHAEQGGRRWQVPVPMPGSSLPASPCQSAWPPGRETGSASCPAARAPPSPACTGTSQRSKKCLLGFSQEAGEAGSPLG